MERPRSQFARGADARPLLLRLQGIPKIRKIRSAVTLPSSPHIIVVDSEVRTSDEPGLSYLDRFADDYKSFFVNPR